MSYYTSLSVDMSLDNARSVEYLLKKEMLKEMTSIQYERAKGDKPNQGTKDRYINHAQALHAIQTAQRRKGYKDLPEMTVYSRDLYDTLDFDGRKDLIEILRELHETGSKPTVS